MLMIIFKAKSLNIGWVLPETLADLHIPPIRRGLYFVNPIPPVWVAKFRVISPYDDVRVDFSGAAMNAT
jgi:hypothetical protein